MEEPTDGQILELSNHLKSLYDKKELELEKIKEKNLELKKIIITAYGSVRLLNEQYNNILLDSETNNFIIEALRSYLSDVVEHEILELDSTF
jgi:DNA-directed RNA polymerase beta' subunit